MLKWGHERIRRRDLEGGERGEMGVGHVENINVANAKDIPRIETSLHRDRV